MSIIQIWTIDFYSPWNLRAYGLLMILVGIKFIIKFFKFANLKGIQFYDVIVKLIFCDSRVIKIRILRDLFLLIRRTRKILWNLFLLVGNLQDFYKYFITKIRNKTNENRKTRQFFRTCFCDWSSSNVLWDLFLPIPKNNSILRNLFLRFRKKSAKINSALINFEKITSLKVIFEANYGNIAKSQN